MRILLLMALLAGCAPLRPFPRAAPMQVDPDREPVAQEPAEYFSPLYWDAVDQTLFRPLSRWLSLDVPGPAVNVNAWDEVPASSWFTPRLGAEPWTPEDSARGACPDDRLDESGGPWTVWSAKPNGANPGFIIRAPDGRNYLLKMDGRTEGVRATTADVFGSRLAYAAGFNAPCNTIVFFDRSILQIDPEATVTDQRGIEEPMSQAHIDAVLAKAVVEDDGRLRASASLFLSGKPLGPFRYQDRRKDDPNDVIRHQDRRELRGSRLLAAWINHFDAREQNSLDMWASGPAGGHVEHYLIDFGDSMGSRWAEDELSRRFGRSYYLHVGHVVASYLTLGLKRWPWETVQVSQVAPALGYFDAEHFDPLRWLPGYPNPAFVAMQPEDGAWMARILARVDDEDLDAMLGEARIHDPVYAAELRRVLVARRDMLLRAWLSLRSPLGEFAVEGRRVCFADLAVVAGVGDPRTTRYAARLYAGASREPLVRWDLEADPEGACFDLPAVAPGPEGLPGYRVVDLDVVRSPGAAPLPPARLHLYDDADGVQLVGIERPKNDRAPALARAR